MKYSNKIQKMKYNRWINKINRYINSKDLFYLLLWALIILIVSWQLNVLFIEHLCDSGSGSESVQDFILVDNNTYDTNNNNNSSFVNNSTLNSFAPNRFITSLKRPIPIIPKPSRSYIKKDLYITKYKIFFKQFTSSYKKYIKLSSWEFKKLSIKVAKAFNYDKYDIKRARRALPKDLRPLFTEYLYKKFGYNEW